MIAVVVSSACSEDVASVRDGKLQFHHIVEAGAEGELLGNLFDGGYRNQEPTYVVRIEPFDQATKARLRGADTLGSEMVAKPGGWAPKYWDYEWFDPKGGGNCGDLTSYEQGHARAPERHTTDPNPSEEKHCIRPGRYRFILKQGGVTIKTFVFQYGQTNQTAPVTNQTTGTTEFVNAVTYDPNYHFLDTIINVDLAGPGSYTENSVVYIENALNNPYKSTFTDQGAPSGARTDYFRYSFYNSITSWNPDSSGKGTMLNRVYFDRGQADSYRTEYFDPKSQEGATLILVNRYNDSNFQISNRYARLGVELMRPDEDVNGSVEVEDSVYISSMQACFSAEKTTTWQTSDQYLNASCSTGSNLQYRWQTTAGGSFTAYSSNPRLDLLGHATTGQHTITLEIRNTATSETTQEFQTMTVQSGILSINGPLFVYDKLLKTYKSNMWSMWHERAWDTELWTPGAGPDTLYTRIWPQGNYTMDIRIDSSTATTLRRGRTTVTVSDEGLPLERILASGIGNEWHFLGGGPILSWGSVQSPAVRQFYQLAGAHERNSPFADAQWMNASGRRYVQTQAGELYWEQKATALENVRVYTFGIDPGTFTAEYVFGFAWDPDIGGAGNDRSAVDTKRNLVYAYDGSGAVGVMIRSNGTSALATVEQFGVGKTPPVSNLEVFQRQRAGQVKLMTGANDVQFMLSAKPGNGSTTWEVVFIRASTVAQLKSTADDYLKR
jgi:hypothetical protein